MQKPRVDIDPAGLPVQARRAPSAGLDTENYHVFAGQWEISGEGKDRVIYQKNPDVTAQIRFAGVTQWNKGEVSCRFKVQQARETGPIIRVVFYYGGAPSDTFGTKEVLAGLLARGCEWICLKVPFEILPGDIMEIRGLEIWPADKPGEKQAFSFRKTPENSAYVKQRKACSIGLLTEGIAAEIRDLQLTNAVPVAMKSE